MLFIKDFIKWTFIPAIIIAVCYSVAILWGLCNSSGLINIITSFLITPTGQWMGLSLSIGLAMAIIKLILRHVPESDSDTDYYGYF